MDYEPDNGIRICSHCGSEMNEGYCWGDGEGYACSDKCLYADGYTEAQKDIDYEEGIIYWTDWQPDEPLTQITERCDVCSDFVTKSHYESNQGLCSTCIEVIN